MSKKRTVEVCIALCLVLIGFIVVHMVATHLPLSEHLFEIGVDLLAIGVCLWLAHSFWRIWRLYE